jgi:hypothetical protein
MFLISTSLSGVCSDCRVVSFLSTSFSLQPGQAHLRCELSLLQLIVKSFKMPFVFSHVEYCDMHFVCGFCNGNARAAVEDVFPTEGFRLEVFYSY